MRPELFHIDLPGLPTLPVYAFGFMVMLGFLVAIWISVRRARLVGIEPSLIIDLGLWVMISGVVGARVFYVVQFHDQFDWGPLALEPKTLASPMALAGGAAISGLFVWRRLAMARGQGRPLRIGWTLGIGLILFLVGTRVAYLAEQAGDYRFDLLRVDKGGLVYYGGLVTALGVGSIFLARHRLNIMRVADCVAPALALGLAFGRIGCHLNGCCWGRRSAVPWAIRFPGEYQGARTIENPAFAMQRDKYSQELGVDDELTLPVHPTQLYASLNAFLLFWILSHWFRRRRFHGEILLLFGLFYGATRFGLEALRADNPATFAGLTISQNLSVAIFSLSAALYPVLGRRYRRRSGGSPGTE